MKFPGFVFCMVLSLSTSAQMKNIKLAELTEGISIPMGVSIAINHKDPKNLIAGAGLNRVMATVDGGKTWNETKMASTFGAGGDPVLIADTKGNFFYFHLSDANGKGPDDDGWLDRIVCHTSTDGGLTWSKDVSIGNNPPKDQVKPRVGTHYALGELYLTWTQFDHYGAKDSTCQSNIFFSKSVHGKRWSDPIQINSTPGDCRDGDNTPNGAMAAININERLFVVWSNQESIFFDRSYDQGNTWLGNDLPIAKQPGGSSMNIPGLGKCSGMPTLIADDSETFFRGSLYVTYSDLSSGENDADIWLIRSINRGDSWSSPQRVNKDAPGKHQFMPVMTVDQATGVVYVVYYDRRAYDDLRTDVYLAYSLDGTGHFSEIKISESPFIPSPDKSMGDYIGITAYKGVIAPIWTRMDDGHTSVWTTVIKQEELFKKSEMPTLQNIRRPPRPYSPNNRY